MKTYLLTLLIAIAGIVVLGCEKSETEKATDATKSAADSAADSAAKAADATKDAADKTAAGGAQATDAMKDAADKTKDAAADASSALTTKANELLEKATNYIKENKFDLANDAIGQLEKIKSQLPAEWASKIDNVKSMLETAKKSGMLPSGTPGK